MISDIFKKRMYEQQQHHFFYHVGWHTSVERDTAKMKMRYIHLPFPHPAGPLGYHRAVNPNAVAVDLGDDP